MLHRNKPTKAIDARITGGFDTDYELYKVINNEARLHHKRLVKEMGWSSGKLYGSVHRL